MPKNKAKKKQETPSKNSTTSYPIAMKIVVFGVVAALFAGVIATFFTSGTVI
jgi:type II secretory pathway component PulF